MATVTRSSTTSIDATPDAVWEQLDAGFLDISAWAGGVLSSVANPATPTGLDGSAHGGRICDVEGVGRTDERLVAFDAGRRSLTYTVRADGLPSFVDHLRNTWTVSDDGRGGATVAVEMQGITKGVLARVGAVLLGRVLGKAATGLPRDLKDHLEVSSHPRA